MTTITRFTDAARMLTASVTDAARLLTTSAARTRATRAHVLTAALALAGTGALALIACHPDDVVAPANGEMITLSATAALPGAGITAGGTASRAATSANRATTRGNSAATTRGTTPPSRDVYFTDNTQMDIVLNKYSSGNSSDATPYAYTLTPTSASKATAADIKPKTTGGGISVPSGSDLYLGIPEMQIKLQMELPTETKYNLPYSGTLPTTALAPFHTRMEMKKQQFTNVTNTALALPLTYTTAALRLCLVPGDGAKVATVTCPLSMADDATTSLPPSRTDGFDEKDSSAPTHQTVIFGELTPGTTLAEGDLIALLQLAGSTDLTTGATTPGKLLAVKCPASLNGKSLPEAGQMMTLTVRLTSNAATITGPVEIDGFEDGNGGGTDGILIGSTVIGSADAPLDESIFNANNPNWKLTGTGTANIKTRLNAIYSDNNNARISLEMPDMTTIGQGAFSSCVNLTAISLPAATEIGKEAFIACSYLTSISLPKAATIGEFAFSGCNNLATISLPAATEIGKNAFNTCSSLTTVSLPKAEKIGEGAFQNRSMLTSIDLPEATYIGLGAFNFCISLTDIDLPKATKIEEQAFVACSSLTNISLPEATEIGALAFGACTELTTASIPKAAKIGQDAFNYCSSLTTIDISEVTDATGIDGQAFDDNLGGTNYFDTEDCDLIVSSTVYSTDVTSSVTGGPKDTFRGRKWKSITVK